MGITEILTIVFIVLKVMHKVDWSWFYVLLPEIIAAVFYIAGFTIAIIHAVKTKREIEKSFHDWE